MSSQHIDFSELEPEDSIDQTHLASCERCRLNYESYRAFRGLVRGIPELEPPPFFAARVAGLATREGTAQGTGSFLFLMQRSAQRLLPVFATLVLTVGFLAFRGSSQIDTVPIEDSELSRILFEEPEAEVVTLEFMLGSLAEEMEGPPVDEQQ